MKSFIIKLLSLLGRLFSVRRRGSSRHSDETCIMFIPSLLSLRATIIVSIVRGISFNTCHLVSTHLITIIHISKLWIQMRGYDNRSQYIHFIQSISDPCFCWCTNPSHCHCKRFWRKRWSITPEQCTLQWRHMKVMSSQITSNSTICLTVFHTDSK